MTTPINGADLAAQLRMAARQRGMHIGDFVSALSPDPGKWLGQLERATRPKPHTVARVQALLAGNDVPPPPPNNFQVSLRTAPLFSRELAIDTSKLPPAVTRDPCLRCGTRADRHAEHGCKLWRAAC